MRAATRIAWNLCRLRIAQQISQEALAADAEVDRSYVSRLERAIENPTIDILERLCAAIAADASDLLEKPSGNTRKMPSLPPRKKGGIKECSVA